MNRDFYDTLDKFGTNMTAIRALFTTGNDELSGDGKKLFEEHKKKLEKSERDGREFTKKQTEKLKEKFIKKLRMNRAKFENRIQSRLQEGRLRGLRSYRFYKVSDLAWDSVPIVPENIPLQLYAQGKISIDSCVSQLKKCVKDKKLTETDFKNIVVSDPNNVNDIKALNLPRLHEVSVNLVRSYLRRRVAAQSNKYNNLYPYYVYEGRSKDMVSKLRSDVLSQRVESIVDQFGYRHDFTQNLRKNFLYGHTVSFVDSAWEEHKQFRTASDAAGDRDIEEYVTKEGVKFITPHPTRVFHDSQFSLSTVNYDNGIKYLGYWDVMRWRDINDNPKYFNRDRIPFSSPEHFDEYRPYFDYYFSSCNPCVIKFPDSFGRSIEEGNTRQSNIGTRFYAANRGDDSMWISNYYERIIPKQVGIGDYPHPVWLRLVVASDKVVIHGEILPSRPASYMGHDADDSKILNQAMAHEIIPYQDQVSNLFSQAIYLMKVQSILVMALDTDQLSPNQRRSIKAIAQGSKYYSELMLVERSESKRQEIFGQPPQTREPITLTQTQAKLGTVINDLLKNVTNIIGMLDKNQMMSPQELGQFAKHETTAQEVNEVSQTTNALFAFISEGPDEYRNAIKRILYESLLALGSDEITVYVQERYPDEIIAAAGFEVRKPDGVDEGYKLTDSDSQNLFGATEDLAMEYLFNTRDGSERTVSTQAAKVLGDLTRYVFSSKEILETFINQYGPEQFTNMISEVFRLSGSGFVLKVPATAQSREQQIAALIAQLQTTVEGASEDNSATLQDLSTLQAQIRQLFEQAQIPLPAENQIAPRQATTPPKTIEGEVQPEPAATPVLQA